MTLSQNLIGRNASDWEALVSHPFFRSAADGTLASAARDSYLCNERAFVAQAVDVFAHILLKAPAHARKHLVGVLDGLVTAQPDLFDRLLESLGLPTGPPPRSYLPPEALALCDGMTDLAASGTYGDGIAAMFVAEASYRIVSSEIAAAVGADTILRDWFRLHTDPVFTDGVDWLTRELDSLEVSAKALEPAFCKAIYLEHAFHTAPLKCSA